MYLDAIIKHKREEVRGMSPPAGRRIRPLHDPLEGLKERPVIAEIKRSSPSRGDIRADVDPVAWARAYARGGAGAISVLTDETFFRGSFETLERVAAEVDLPLLCKDFIIDEVQVDRAHASGADFILLIAAALDDDALERLSRRARELGMKVLYEIHDIGEFEKIRGLGPEMVGVNSRDLKTFAIDRDAAAKTLAALRGDFLKVAESGIESVGDIRHYREHGAGAFLIGSALMMADDPAAAMARFAAMAGGTGNVR
jgi:indole-3-glycerol phosphate synthase